MDAINYISKEELKKLLIQERLINTKTTLKSIDKFSRNNALSNLYFGTGLANKKQLTVGVPFDFLVMPLMAEKIRRRLGLNNIFHIIADNHAISNGFSKETVHVAAKRYKRQVEDIADIIGIDNYFVSLASEISTDILHNRLVSKTLGTQIGNTYARFEAADIEYFRVTRNVGLKMGWALNSNGKFDETFFDKKYADVFGNLILPIYTSPGKRLDDLKPNAVPYTIFNDDLDYRFIISKEEDASHKIESCGCNDQTIAMLKKHYNALVRLYLELVNTNIDRQLDLWKKIDLIIKNLTQ